MNVPCFISLWVPSSPRVKTAVNGTFKCPSVSVDVSFILKRILQINTTFDFLIIFALIIHNMISIDHCIKFYNKLYIYIYYLCSYFCKFFWLKVHISLHKWSLHADRLVCHLETPIQIRCSRSLVCLKMIAGQIWKKGHYNLFITIIPFRLRVTTSSQKEKYWYHICCESMELPDNYGNDICVPYEYT